MTVENRLSLGLIGCGEFARFALRSLRELGGVRIAAVADASAEAARRAARELSVPAESDPHSLLARPDVDMVYVATPPASHYRLVRAALEAGKHCLCEKPLALTVEDADELVATAHKRKLIVPVNFVLRYNAVTEAVKAVIDSGVMGRPLAGRFTNCAKDTTIPAGHWFWDKSVSGGIFIEHGVHFFDLYHYWLGEAEIIFAHTEVREGTRQEDRATCEMRFAGGAIVSHYHGFDQMTVMDRAEHRIIFEMGDVRVAGWIPLEVSVYAALDDAGADALAACLPGAEAEVLEQYDARRGLTTSRGQKRRISQRVRLRYEPEPDKEKVYLKSIGRLMSDQIAFLRDGDHRRKVVEENGRDALVPAARASEMGQHGRHR